MWHDSRLIGALKVGRPWAFRRPLSSSPPTSGSGFALAADPYRTTSTHRRIGLLSGGSGNRSSARQTRAPGCIRRWQLNDLAARRGRLGLRSIGRRIPSTLRHRRRGTLCLLAFSALQLGLMRRPRGIALALAACMLCRVFGSPYRLCAGVMLGSAATTEGPGSVLLLGDPVLHRSCRRNRRSGRSSAS